MYNTNSQDIDIMFPNLPISSINGKFKGMFCRNHRPFSLGAAVRFAQESMSVFSRNGCPLCTGMGVRFAQEYVEEISIWKVLLTIATVGGAILVCI